MPNVDLASLSVAVAVIIAIVNGFQLGVVYFFGQENADKVKGFVSFLLGVLLGVVFGLLHWFSLESVQIGLIAGLVSSGLFKLTQNIGGK